MNIAAKHIGREVFLEGEQCNGREVVEDDDGQDYQDHLEGSLLHWMHHIPARPGMLQCPENRYVTKHHESKCCEDHHCEDFVKVHNVAYAFSRGVGQNNKPNQNSQHRSVLTVLELGEDDGVDHGHVSVQANAAQKEWREVFYAVEEAQDVPGAGGGEEDDVGQFQGRNETEEHVQKCQVNDKDI